MTNTPPPVDFDALKDWQGSRPVKTEEFTEDELRAIEALVGETIDVFGGDELRRIAEKLNKMILHKMSTEGTEES